MNPHPAELEREGRDAVAPADGEPRIVAGRRLLRRIGQGGMSTVYLGYDPATLAPVAVKLLADHLSGSRQFIDRFHREARMSRLLAHPNLVRGLDAGFDPAAGLHYLVLEFVDGPTAHALVVSNGRLPVGAVVAIGAATARALGYLHANNYVHRDVKPDNILIDPTGVAKLTDLGLAKLLVDDTSLTLGDQSVGTPQYMPHEQAANPGLVDGRSDLFALGATLYHLLTGRVPFRGATFQEIARDKATAAYRPARGIVPTVPDALDHILARAMARDIRSRYQSADEFAADLDATGLATSLAHALTSGVPPLTVVPSDAPTQPVLARLADTDQMPSLTGPAARTR